MPPAKDGHNLLLRPHRMSDADPTFPTTKPSSGGAGSSPLGQSAIDLTDTQMQGALAPGTSGSAGTASRGWQPPTVEELQKMLPQYEVRQFLARGGMGAVYKGWQRSLDRIVAIKILPPGIEDADVQYAERFKQEARAMAKFKHPGIVAVHDAGETASGLLYFIMEFIEGTDVAQLVAAHGKLPVAQALSITAQVCDALAYAHGRGIVHRDIKPSNIMIEADGTVKVADFGLAKVVAQESAALTRSDMSLGTPDFIAPESMIPGLKVDARADLYAVGVMLYQMLTGHIPRGRFRLPSGIVQEIDPRLDAIVDKALQTDREQRYASALEMKADVERVSDHRGNEITQTNKAGRNARAPLLIAAAVVIVLLAGGWHFWKGRNGSTTGPVTTQARETTTLEPGAIRLWDSPEKLPKLQGAHWENDAVRLDNALLENREPLSADAILQASVRTNPDSLSPSICLRGLRVSANDDEKYSVAFIAKDREVQLHVFTKTGRRMLQAWPFPRDYGPDEWARLELRVISDELTVSVDGKVLGSVHESSLTHRGSAQIYAKANGYFRDIVYVPLDKPDNSAPKSAPAGSDGFRPLFDGRTLTGWRALDRDAAPADWHVADGSLTGTPRSCLMTRDEFGDFDLRLEWRVNPQGNGGIYYHISENGMVERPMKAVEFNLMDDSLSSNPLKATGSAFDVQPPSEQAAHPPGEWNTARLLVQGSRVEHWINDRLVCRYDLAEPATREALQRATVGSEFSSVKKGRIALQAWSGEVFYRNVRIRETGHGGASPPEAWTDWVPADLQHQGWNVEPGGVTTDLPIRGDKILPDDTRDAAARMTYLLRDASGVQITARERVTNGKRAMYVAEEEKGILQIGREMPDGAIKPLVNRPYPPDFTREGEHTLEFRTVGDTLTATLNGTFSITARDDTLPEGEWAMVLKKGALVKKLETQALRKP